MAQRLDFAASGLHPRRPFPQSAGIILAESKSAGEFQSGLLRFLAETPQRRQHTTGKDIVADEIRAGTIAREQVIANGDGLDDGPPAALQALGNASEILRPVMFAHRL